MPCSRRREEADFRDKPSPHRPPYVGGYRRGLTMHASGSRLEAITKELRLQWQQTKDYWADAKAQEFEQRYLQELFGTVDKTVAAIDQIDKLVTKIRNECE